MDFYDTTNADANAVLYQNKILCSAIFPSASGLKHPLAG
jgi:hypothetical protein